MYNYGIADDNSKALNVLDIPGNNGDNATGVMPGGFEVTRDNYLVTYNTASNPANTDSNRNVFLGLVPIDNYSPSAVRNIQITGYTGKTTCSTPRLVNLGNNRYMLLWDEYSQDTPSKYNLAYVYIDGDGNLLGSIGHDDMVSLDPAIQPILYEEKVITNLSKGTSQAPSIEYLEIPAYLDSSMPDNTQNQTDTDNPDVPPSPMPTFQPTPDKDIQPTPSSENDDTQLSTVPSTTDTIPVGYAQYQNAQMRLSMSYPDDLQCDEETYSGSTVNVSWSDAAIYLGVEVNLANMETMQEHTNFYWDDFSHICLDAPTITSREINGITFNIVSCRFLNHTGDGYASVNTIAFTVQNSVFYAVQLIAPEVEYSEDPNLLDNILNSIEITNQ